MEPPRTPSRAAPALPPPYSDAVPLESEVAEDAPPTPTSFARAAPTARLLGNTDEPEPLR